jgi:hypothetical protein
MADKVNAIPLKRKMTIRCVPRCKFYNGKWYTELKAIEIEDWVKPQKYIPKTVDGNDASANPNGSFNGTGGTYNQLEMMKQLEQRQSEKHETGDTADSSNQGEPANLSAPELQTEFSFNPNPEITETTDGDKGKVKKNNTK